MLDRILAAIDDSPEGARALRMAIGLAREIGADLKVIILLKPLPACFSSRCLGRSPASRVQSVELGRVNQRVVGCEIASR
jgi:nucleotide-binding universal stress UspA family protein